MLLGRTFDYSKSEIGNDIISEDERNNAQTIRNDRSDIKYKMIKSSEDVRDVLDVSGQLSVKVMAGTVDVEGKGSYLKSSINSENSVEVMVQVYYKTVCVCVIYIWIVRLVLLKCRGLSLQPGYTHQIDILVSKTGIISFKIAKK